MRKILLPLLVIVAGAGLAKTYYMKSEIAERYNLSKLQSIAEVASQNLPVMVDDMTRFERVTAADKVLEKHYKLVSLRRSDIDIEMFSTQMKKYLIDQSCQNSQSMNLFDSGVSEWYTYSDESDGHILTLKIGAKDC